MFKVKLQFSRFIALFLVFVCVTFFTVDVANSQRLLLSESQSKTSNRETSKYKLASEVLPEIGIAKRYDLHFDHLMGTLIGKRENSEYARFRKMFVREIGWKYFKDAYAARLEADFSVDELKELLKLSKQPVMKKLLQSETKVYMDTSKQRFKIGFQLWENYNEGKINLPLN
jgi:Uncharacterized protein conserved in bacteria (DUF2059)